MSNRYHQEQDGHGPSLTQYPDRQRDFVTGPRFRDVQGEDGRRYFVDLRETPVLRLYPYHLQVARSLSGAATSAMMTPLSSSAPSGQSQTSVQGAYDGAGEFDGAGMGLDGGASMPYAGSGYLNTHNSSHGHMAAVAGGYASVATSSFGEELDRSDSGAGHPGFFFTSPDRQVISQAGGNSEAFHDPQWVGHEASDGMSQWANDGAYPTPLQVQGQDVQLSSALYGAVPRMAHIPPGSNGLPPVQFSPMLPSDHHFTNNMDPDASALAVAHEIDVTHPRLAQQYAYVDPAATYNPAYPPNDRWSPDNLNDADLRDTKEDPMELTEDTSSEPSMQSTPTGTLPDVPLDGTANSEHHVLCGKDGCLALIHGTTHAVMMKNLKRHQDRDHEKKTFPCEVAGCSTKRPFTREDNLQRHLRKRHPGLH